MIFLPSNNIKIFPFGGNRSAYDPYGRVLNEYNLARLVKSIVDYPSYVIEYDSSSKKLRFVINGYYCECELPQDTNGPLYAGINMSTDETNNYAYVNGDDSNEVFTGLSLAHSKEELGNMPSLHLLDESNKVPTSSFLKFENRSTGSGSYTLIDCGSSEKVIGE